MPSYDAPETSWKHPQESFEAPQKIPGQIGERGDVQLDFDPTTPDRGKTYIVEFCQEVQESINRILSIATNIEAYPLLQMLDPLIDAQLALVKFNKLEDRLEDVRLHEAYNTAQKNLSEISKQIDVRLSKRGSSIGRGGSGGATSVNPDIYEPPPRMIKDIPQA